jgi:hypothetical protein
MALLRRAPHGLFIGSHAIAEGVVTQAQLDRGTFRRVLRGVYAPPGLRHDHELVARAAALLMPPEAVLGGRTAALWWQAPTAGPRDPVCVLVPPSSAWRGPHGVRVHRTEVARHDVHVLDDGTRVTALGRTVRDVAVLERLADAVACIDAMAFAGVLDEGTVRRVHEQAAGRWGSRRLTRVLSLVDGRAQSPPESWVRVACHLAGLPEPVPQFAVLQDGVHLGTVDLAWPDARVVVEYEGPYHFEDRQIRRDDRRYDRLAAAGWHVIRLSAYDVRDMDAVVERIRAALVPVAV